MRISRRLLWWPTPASLWTEAIPIGNGRLGGMVYGSALDERIALNEDTLWSGEPRDLQNYEAIRYLDSIEQLLLEGKENAAEQVSDAHLLGAWNESFMPLGELRLPFEPRTGQVTDYRRSSDLMRGLVSVEYKQNGRSYRREVFASAPDQVMALRIACDGHSDLNFAIALESKLHAHLEAMERGLVLHGKCPAHVEPNYADSPLPIIWEDQAIGKGMSFEIRL